MKNDSNILKRASRVTSPLPSDPLERARREAQDVKDIKRDEARRLKPYDADDEESTARHDVPQPPPSVHVHLHSQPDGDAELGELPRLTKGWPKWMQLIVAIGFAGLMALATALIARATAR